MSASSGLKTRFEQLQQRERYIIVALAVVILLFIWDQLLFSPLLQSSKKAKQQTAALTAEIGDISQRLVKATELAAEDPNVLLRKRKGQVQARIGQLDEQMGALMTGLIPPQEMGRILEQVVRDHKGLRLVKVSSLKAERIMAEGSEAKELTAENKVEEALYRHGIEIELEGEYFTTMRYLQALEKLPWRLIWNSLDYEVNNYPQARVRIRINTMSTNAGWIGV